jgi:hypothetical protein
MLLVGVILLRLRLGLPRPHGLLLGRLPIRQPLRLLLVALLHLLGLGVASLLLAHPLMPGAVLRLEILTFPGCVGQSGCPAAVDTSCLPRHFRSLSGPDKQ